MSFDCNDPADPESRLLEVYEFKEDQDELV